MTPKFRAYDKQTGQMFKVSELYFNGSGVRACRIIGQTSKSQYKKSDFMYSDRFVLMQWIGIKDSNDVKIYDGDIIEGRLNEEMYQTLGVPEYVEGQTIKYSDTGYFAGGINPMAYETITVIGNVHQHPELLNTTE